MFLYYLMPAIFILGILAIALEDIIKPSSPFSIRDVGHRGFSLNKNIYS